MEFRLLSPNKSSEARPDRVGVIDVIAHDQKTDQVVLVMEESEPWTGQTDQLFRLQERFNAYVSFLLDGELAESHPQLAQKRARIELRCRHLPDAPTIDLLGQVRDQLALQEIDVQVIVRSAA